MNEYWQKHRQTIIFLLSAFITWRIYLFIPLFLSSFFIPQRTGYIGAIPWANFDGVHYLSIASRNYLPFEQAFFPFFPLLIRVLSFFLLGNELVASLIIVHGSLLIALVYFWKLLNIDYKPSVALWSVLFLLAFPTAFFLGSIYTESLFLALVFASLYYGRKKQFVLACLLAGLASATRVVGIFLFVPLAYELYLALPRTRRSFFSLLRHAIPLLLIPLGLFAYMIYLAFVYHDPLLFVHVQSAFGAGRSSGQIILLPQVLWRYVKIFLTVPLSNSDYWLAWFELLSFSVIAVLLFIAYKMKVRMSYLLFCFLVLFFPTLSGTLSSMPRYILVCFTTFLVLGKIKDTRLRSVLFAFSLVLQAILAGLFLRGYFIA
jgi:Gpi18-like mannosyltransferase